MVKKTNVLVLEIVYGGLVASDVQKAVEKGFETAFQNCVMVVTKDKENEAEAYANGMRNKLHDKYLEFVTKSDREQFISKLQEVEDCLYEDKTKGVYIAKLEEVKKISDSQNFQRFMIYVHAKGMVVDDEYVTIGSTNINQRSMVEIKDTKIAMGAYQPHHTWAKKQRHPHG